MLFGLPRNTQHSRPEILAILKPMSDTVVVALISSGSATLVAITALLLNYRGFTSIENRLAVIEHDVKEFYRLLGLHDTEIVRLKDKTGLN
jgi:hypothetical protein